MNNFKLKGYELEDLFINKEETINNRSIKIFNIKELKNIYLNGVSGFLGIHILLELLELVREKDIKINVLIRGNNIKDCKDKFKKNFLLYFKEDQYKLFIKNKNNKIIKSDCCNKNWDIKYKIKDSLIIHCASIVNSINSIYKMEENYKSILNIKDKINEGNNKFIYISSLSTFVSSSFDKKKRIKEQSMSSDLEYYGGYAQSKYLAEKIIEKNISNYLIIRPSLITASLKHPIFKEKEYFNIFLKNIDFLKNYDENNSLNYLPVDVVSKKIVENLNKEYFFHLANKKNTKISYIKNIYDRFKINRFSNNEKQGFIEKKIIENATQQKVKINKYFNINLFQGNFVFNGSIKIKDNKYIKEYIKGVLENEKKI
jgi:thioester reductase-like protein